MKRAGLIIILSVGVLVAMLVLMPIGTRVTVTKYSEPVHLYGQLRLGQVLVENEGWFARTVQLPAFVACAGDREVPVDLWMSTNDAIVRGVDSPQSTRLQRGERGSFYVIAGDAHLEETLVLYYRTQPFSCLTSTSRV